MTANTTPFVYIPVPEPLVADLLRRVVEFTEASPTVAAPTTTTSPSAAPTVDGSPESPWADPSNLKKLAGMRGSTAKVFVSTMDSLTEAFPERLPTSDLAARAGVTVAQMRNHPTQLGRIQPKRFGFSEKPYGLDWGPNIEMESYETYYSLSPEVRDAWVAVRGDIG